MRTDVRFQETSLAPYSFLPAHGPSRPAPSRHGEAVRRSWASQESDAPLTSRIIPTRPRPIQFKAPPESRRNSATIAQRFNAGLAMALYASESRRDRRPGANQ